MLFYLIIKISLVAMRKFISILCISVVLLTVSTNFGFAQKNTGYINSELLISLMPEAKKVKNELEKLAKTYDDEFQNIEKEFETKAKKYQAEAKVKSEAINQTREKELQDMQQRLQEYRQNAGKDLQTKRVELLKPVLEKAQKAIDKVSKRKKLDYVFDSSKGILLYANEAKDIIEDVKKVMGIKKK